MAEINYPLEWIPYIDGATYQGTVVAATNGGYARYANLTAAKNIWSSAPSAGDKGNELFPPPTCALIAVNTQAVRQRSGVDPSATEGFLIPVGTIIALDNEPDLLRDWRIFQATATAEVTIQYFYTLA